ncbi:hypothetical protein [Corynebacterium senegalense]|uniref:hypothetical protein n=1 Tax=Corynebacterium senegalense TaxID=2080750 RepID=UPI000E20018B|nr:hypothetical protein [Corynebacterium senegalense]
MTTHPSIQPALTRSNVTTLIRFILNERDDVMACPESAGNTDNTGYVRGLQYAVDAITTMWASAVIAADAHAQDLANALDEDDS